MFTIPLTCRVVNVYSNKYSGKCTNKNTPAMPLPPIYMGAKAWPGYFMDTGPNKAGIIFYFSYKAFPC